MCMPNLKIVALPVCEILRGSQNFQIGSRPQATVATPNFGPVCGPGQELPTAYVHAKFEGRSFFHLRNIEGVPKFRNWVTYPRPRPLRGQFVVRGQELPTAYVRTKFEGRSFIRLRNIGTFRCAALIDPMTLTSMWESHVTWGTHVQSFVFLGLLVFELELMYAASDRPTPIIAYGAGA